MNTQLELLKQAVALAEANPDAEIHICATSDELLDDGRWTAHEISSVDLGVWFANDENILTDLSEVQDHFFENAVEEISEEEAERLASEAAKPAILIYTRAGS